MHAAVTARWGERGVVELAGVIGYYTMVSMTLNAHEIPLPDGAKPAARAAARRRADDLAGVRRPRPR